jgi:hypothetical protein
VLELYPVFHGFLSDEITLALPMQNHPTGGIMKYILLVVALLLSACDNSTPAPKIAAPQREALEKAKGVDQAVQKNAEETQNKAKEAEGY